MSLELASQKKENCVSAVLRALSQQNSAHTLYFNLWFLETLELKSNPSALETSGFFYPSLAM